MVLTGNTGLEPVDSRLTVESLTINLIAKVVASRRSPSNIPGRIRTLINGVGDHRFTIKLPVQKQLWTRFPIPLYGPTILISFVVSISNKLMDPF